MMPNRPLLLAAAAIVSLVALSAPTLSAQRTPDLAPYLMPNRAAEIALARTAAPRSISDSATVLVLTKTGYVDAVRGTNGFVCMVQRSFFGPVGDPGFWDPANRGPVCINPPAARTVLADIRKRAEWIMTGVSPAEVGKRTREAYASHVFPMPAPGAMAYMLSPEQHLSPTNPHWMPHVMFYYDTSLPAAAWGLGDANSAIIDGPADGAGVPVRLLLIPVRRWSDGTSAMPGGGK
jgi:hypothetical protein